MARGAQMDACSQIMIEIMTSIVDDLCFDVCADIHRSHRMHMLAFEDSPGQPVLIVLAILISCPLAPSFLG